MSNAYRYSRVNNVVNCIRNTSTGQHGEVSHSSWQLIVRRAQAALVYQGKPNALLIPQVREIANEVLAMNQLASPMDFRLRFACLRASANLEFERRTAELTLGDPLLPCGSGGLVLAGMVQELQRRINASRLVNPVIPPSPWQQIVAEASKLWIQWKDGTGAPRNYPELELAREVMLVNDSLPSSPNAAPPQHKWVVIVAVAANVRIQPPLVTRTPELDSDIQVKSALVSNVRGAVNRMARDHRDVPSSMEWTHLVDSSQVLIAANNPDLHQSVRALANFIVSTNINNARFGGTFGSPTVPNASEWIQVVNAANVAGKLLISAGMWRVRMALDSSSTIVNHLAKLLIRTDQYAKRSLRWSGRGNGNYLNSFQWSRIVQVADHLLNLFRIGMTDIHLDPALLQLSRDVMVMDSNRRIVGRQYPLENSFEALCEDARTVLGVPRLDAAGQQQSTPPTYGGVYYEDRSKLRSVLPSVKALLETPGFVEKLAEAGYKLNPESEVVRMALPEMKDVKVGHLLEVVKRLENDLLKLDSRSKYRDSETHNQLVEISKQIAERMPAVEPSHPYNAQERDQLWAGVNPNIKLSGFSMDGLVRFARRWSSLTIAQQNVELTELRDSKFVIVK